MTLDIKKDYDISKLTTLRVVAHAEFYVEPTNLEELIEAFKEIKQQGQSWNVLGAGSNLLLSSRKLEGFLLATKKLDFLQLEGVESTYASCSDDEVLVEAGTGLRMPRFTALTFKQSLTGAEFMEGIPGSVGGGVVMNAGAHGSEFADIFVSAKVLDLESLEIEEWNAEKIAFEYRKSSINPHRYFVYSAIFKLKQGDKTEIREKIVKYSQARLNSQPIKSWTCGCTFKNPANEGAGRLIDELGLKGTRVGDFVVSNQHGNFFENKGTGTSMDFCKLMKIVQDTVMEKTGIFLKPEVQRMGYFTEEELKIWNV